MTRHPHPFLDGRRVIATAPLAAATYVTSYAFWYGSIDGGRCGVGVVELLGFTFALVGTWLLTPAMATWEATSTPALRRMATVAQLGVITAATLTPILVYLAVTRLPARVVPRSARYDFGDLGITTWLPAATNLAVLACIATIAIAVTGRLAGTIITLAAYPALFWLATNTTAAPYTAFCSTDTGPPAWIPAAAFVAAAFAVLTATGGTTVLSRRLDPRHTG